MKAREATLAKYLEDEGIEKKNKKSQCLACDGRQILSRLIISVASSVQVLRENEGTQELK